MDKEIKVSVLCNVYNHGPYVRDALEGFVNQKTDFAFEVLVHDDASTDNSADVIREYEMKYPDLIKPIYQTENQVSQKISVYKNFQEPRTRGKYVAVCEGDDYWTDPLKLQKQYDFMEAHPEYSLCACGTEWYNVQTGIREKRAQIAEDRDITLEEIIEGKDETFFQYGTVFVKTEVFYNRPSWRAKFPIGDYALTLVAALNGKVRKLADVMTVYRYYAANSWTVRMDNDESRARISKRMIEGLEALDEDTEHRYHEVIAKRILRHRYTLALMTHDYRALREGELGKVYRSRSLAHCISDTLRCKYPKFYTKAMKPLAKVLKSIHGKK